MDHSKLLETYLTHACSRRVEVSPDLGVGEIKVSATSVEVSHHFISPDTDLIRLKERVSTLITAFNSRKDEEKARVSREIEAVILHRFAWLHRIDPEKAHDLLTTLTRQYNG